MVSNNAMGYGVVATLGEKSGKIIRDLYGDDETAGGAGCLPFLNAQ